MERKINDILILLCKGIANRKLYFSDHPKVRNYVGTFIAGVDEYFRLSDKDEFFIGIIDGSFIFNGRRLFGPTVVGKQLILFMEMLRCGGISFKNGVREEDIRRFMDLTESLKTPLKGLQEARELFRREGIESINLAVHYSDQAGLGPAERKRPWEGQEIGGFLQSPTMIYQALFDVVTQAHGDAALDREVDIDSARSVSEFMLRYTRSNFADVMQYIHYPDYESYTVGHSVRVASIAVFMGMRMNWKEEDILALGTAGILHDIGKSKIPGEILYKTDRLSPDEYTMIKDHPRVGAELLLAQRDVSPLDIAASWGHHIRFDGKGYPEKPVWAVRSPVISLLQICDVFEAMTAVRPYKQAMDPHSAFALMISDKNAFHPGLLGSFISMVGLYPPGTYVSLSDGRTGMVTEAGQALDRPKVRITALTDGTRIKDQDQYVIDLGNISSQSLAISRLLLNYLPEGQPIQA